jgi:AcrR family transcriptional regulator
MDAGTVAPARTRILAAAARRYYADGIRAASADRLLAQAGVSKATFYRHFPTKDALVVAYLEWQAAQERERLEAQRALHAGDPAAVLRWYAEAVGHLVCGEGFRGCPFINAAAELSEPSHPGRAVVAAHRAWLVDQAAELLLELGVDRAEAKAGQLMMLRDGAMVAGALGRRPDEVTAQLVAAGRAIMAA